jgi:hypothetical protein
VAFCCMCAVLCAWVIASSKVVRRPWTGIWYTSLFCIARGSSHSTLTLSVKLFVCWFVCLLSPSIQLCCLSVAARRIQVRKIRDMRRIHRLRRITLLTHIRLPHCALVPLRICASHCLCVCVYTTRDRTKWGEDWGLEILFFPLVIITQCPLLICIECWV